MKKDLAKLAVVGLMASFCLSASSSTDGKEIAMSKCSKDNSQGSSCGNSKGSSCSGSNKDNSCSSNKNTSCSSNSNKNGSSCGGNGNGSSCGGGDGSVNTETAPVAPSAETQSSDNALLKAKREKISEKVAKAD